MCAAVRRPRPGRRSRQRGHVGKPNGVFSPRVQKVGPQHFGVVSVDCAKDRSKWMLTDFYGHVVVPPTFVEHHRTAFDQAVAAVRSAVSRHGIKDLVVAVERTGRYHRPVQSAFAAAGFDTRVVHPSVSCYFREAGAYDTKTDDTDLEGIFRAAVNGFGLQEQPWDAVYGSLQLWSRQRRDLVDKTSQLRCQILEYLNEYLPGYQRCFDDVFISKVALLIACHYAAPQAIAAAGLSALVQLCRQAHVQVHNATLMRIMGWAQDAPAPEQSASFYQQWVCNLNEDRLTKEKQIAACEQQLVALLVQTPYVRLLALSGINVVLASELAGELGPMTYYATARVITGRAGLYPRRYQSDQVDHASGTLARRGNRRLRYVLVMSADTLMRCNQYFGVLRAKWAHQGRDPRDIRVRVAGRYSRISFQMVTGKGGFRHPACQGPPAVLSKLIEFHNEPDIDPYTARTNLQRAAAQLPRAEQAREKKALHAQLDAARQSWGRGPKQLCSILPAVLEQLGGVPTNLIKSIASGETP